MALPECDAVTVDGLVKTYGERTVVDGISFTVKRGQVFALLGPNGAGKTTTIEILEGYRRADSGRVEVLGVDPARSAVELKSKMGVMLQEGGIYPTMTARDSLRLFAGFYEHPRDPDELLALVGLSDVAGTRFRRLSGGQKQRLQLALALIGRPLIVFLDEPTAGLDPKARRSTWEIVRGLKHEGVTVVLTTHYLDEAEELADCVGIVDSGRLVALDSPAALVRQDASLVRLRTSRPISPDDLCRLRAMRSMQELGSGQYLIETDNASELAVEVTTLLRDRSILMLELRLGQGSLEDVFLSLTGKEYHS